MYKRVLIGLDGSDCSQSGGKIAISLARKLDAELIASHVYSSELHAQRFRDMEQGLPEQYQDGQIKKKLRESHDSLIVEGFDALSQGYYTWGDVFLIDDEAKKTAFIRGQYWGLKSLRMSSAFATEEVQHGFIEAVSQEIDVPALFWTYGNWSRKDEYDPLGAIARNDLPKLEALIERVFETNPTYSANGPYRALAAFWGGLPPLPLYKYGQNLPRALSYICPVVNDPGYCVACGDCPVSEDVDDYFENRLIFAQYYLMEKRLWEDAARVLQSILDDEIGERFVLYNAYCVDRAQILLEEVAEHL